MNQARVYHDVQEATTALRRKGFKPVLSGPDAGRVWKRVRDGVLSSATISPQSRRMRVTFSQASQPRPIARMPQPIQKQT